MENSITLQGVGEFTITTIPQHHTKKLQEQKNRRLERLLWFLTRHVGKDGKIHIDEVMKYASLAENLEMYKELERELNRPAQDHLTAYDRVTDTTTKRPFDGTPIKHMIIMKENVSVDPKELSEFIEEAMKEKPE